jgi:glycosyltransferase involved in cell wall biosynthesis
MNSPREADFQQPLLTVIVPVYNEERTVGLLLQRLMDGPYPYPQKEIVVVDDGSTDRTSAVLQRWRDQPGVRIVRHPVNGGKGVAVRTGLALARGDLTIIQDADLEYDPGDYPKLVQPILEGRADLVYGSRFLAPQTHLPWNLFRFGVGVLNFLVMILYARRLTDEATCYKATRTELLRNLDLQAERFELCPEITAKACRRGLRIMEVPVSYHPRLVSEGKKIRWRDGWQALWTLLRLRFCGS